MRNSLPPAVFIMGPTATGKTDLAMRLCDEFPFEIVSVDSALIYRDMDIGTAKPSADTLERYPHRLVNILDPAEVYSAAQFRSDALSAMDLISKKGKVPLLVGGTMLYFRALQHGLSVLPESDANVRTALQLRLETEGLEVLHEQLRKVDPQAATRIHPNDPQRILRALEVYELAGEPLSYILARQPDATLDYRILKLVLWAEKRDILHTRIANRFDHMLEQGFVDEVERLRTRGDLDLDKPSMRAVGYRQVWQYLDGDMNKNEMRERGVIATRQLAKRQTTWLRSEIECQRIDFETVSYERVVADVGAWLAK